MNVNKKLWTEFMDRKLAINCQTYDELYDICRLCGGLGLVKGYATDHEAHIMEIKQIWLTQGNRICVILESNGLLNIQLKDSIKRNYGNFVEIISCSELACDPPKIMGVINCPRFDSNVFIAGNAVRIESHISGADVKDDAILISVHPFYLEISTYNHNVMEYVKIEIDEVLSGKYKVLPMLPERERMWEMIGESWKKKDL